jgi:cysteine desulfurase family protein
MIYLDNAATSFPKPEPVYQAVDHYQRQLGAPAGRGAYAAAVEATAIVARCRARLARLLNVQSPERVLLTFNGTDSLNIALKGLLRENDHVVTSVLEHNSVLRPLRALRDSHGIEVTQVPADGRGFVDPEAVRRAMRPGTRLVAMIHASNVTGAIQPVAEIGAIARERGAFFLVDAAQTLGHLPIDLSRLPIDLLAAPGHKGLLGPLGTGLLYVRPGVERFLATWREGGTGTSSEDDQQPQVLPYKYESGNHNVLGLAGLHAALDWIEKQGLERLRDHQQSLVRHLLALLEGQPGITVAGPVDASPRVGVVSVMVNDLDPHDVAAILDSRAGMATRAGLHCAPGAHRAIGSFERGGTVRLSAGPFNTQEQMAEAAAALVALARAS